MNPFSSNVIGYAWYWDKDEGRVCKIADETKTPAMIDAEDLPICESNEHLLVLGANPGLKGRRGCTRLGVDCVGRKGTIPDEIRKLSRVLSSRNIFASDNLT